VTPPRQISSEEDNLAKQWDESPAMQIDLGKAYKAHVETDIGTFVLNLFADRAPETVNNFVFLAREGFYDGTIFHRVIKDFMAQGGDPTGTGSGGPGYQFKDEFHGELAHDRAGILSMANAGPNTNGSQFFITYAATPWLDGKHNVFGEVSEGMDVVQAIRPRDPAKPEYSGVKILHMRIEEIDA
jgi:cyclophilin family peptidyl-prolyl cis-trans isomerase